MTDAPCTGPGADAYFFADERSQKKREAARALCEDCPILPECRDYSLWTMELSYDKGLPVPLVAAGMTEREIMRARGVEPPPPRGPIGRRPRPPAPCKTDGCDRMAKSRGLCNRCFSRERYHRLKADEGDGRPRCSADGCEKPAAAKGLCNNCHSRERYRIKRAAELASRPPAPPKPPKPTHCSAEGCGGPHYVAGLCRGCYGKEYRRRKAAERAAASV